MPQAFSPESRYTSADAPALDVRALRARFPLVSLTAITCASCLGEGARTAHRDRRSVRAATRVHTETAQELRPWLRSRSLPRRAPSLARVLPAASVARTR